MNGGRRLSGWFMILVIFIAIGSVVWFALPDAPASVRPGDMISEFTLPDIKGAMHSLPKGEVVLLNFWATWCPPCRKEIPSMAVLHDKYAAQGLKVIAVSVDKESRNLQAFMREYSLPFQVLHDADSTVAHGYGVFRYPESFLIDRNGKVVYHLIGAKDWMSESITQTIEGMLKQSKS